MESFFWKKKIFKTIWKIESFESFQNFYVNFVHSNYVAAHAFMQRIYHAF